MLQNNTDLLFRFFWGSMLRCKHVEKFPSLPRCCNCWGSGACLVVVGEAFPLGQVLLGVDAQPRVARDVPRLHVAVRVATTQDKTHAQTKNAGVGGWKVTKGSPSDCAALHQSKTHAQNDTLGGGGDVSIGYPSRCRGQDKSQTNEHRREDEIEN